ncbi:type II toxin-antitoxin system RelE/ParE family toxin [Flavobacterium sp.]|uniref:type II toxin-antitoxin system RelE/ParE family toxin n=1 Tax=Flavobacterium sp. TaxID=239 RepID=UPI004047151D
MVEKVVVWDTLALLELEDIFDYLKDKSFSSAKKDVTSIVDLTEGLSKDYEIYDVDKFKSSNDGSYRALEEYNYRISYRITSNQIRILKVRHTSRNPKLY